MKRKLSILAGILVTGALIMGSTVPAQAAAPVSSPEIQQIFKATNAARAAAGLRPLILDPAITAVAQKWSQQQAREKRMYHNPQFFSQIPKGAFLAGENVAWGYSAANVVPNGWMKSPGHRANILRSNFTHIGIGFSNGYATQVLAAYPKGWGSSTKPKPVVTQKPVAKPTAKPVITAKPVPKPAPVVKLTASDFSIRSHVQNIGWKNNSGSVGKGLRLESLELTQKGTERICLSAHVQNIGWQAKKCTNGKGTKVTAGTAGRGLRLEALVVSSPDAQVSAEAHVQNIGWQGKRTAKKGANLTVGTMGSGLRLEAVRFF